MTNDSKNSKDSKLHNQLITAIICNNIRAIKQVLKHEVKINQADKSGVTPLMYAIDFGNTDVAELLIKSGANVNAINKKGNNALMEIISKPNYPNRYAMTKLLLKNNIDVNYVGQFGRTALYLCKLYQPRYIALLKRFGARY